MCARVWLCAESEPRSTTKHTAVEVTAGTTLVLVLNNTKVSTAPSAKSGGYTTGSTYGIDGRLNDSSRGTGYRYRETGG